MNSLNILFNVLLGILSFFGIIAGFLIKDYQFLFWSISSALLIVVVLSYYVFDNHSKINLLVNKFNKIEETLNIYDRLNKLELKMKKAQINLIDIIKIGLAAILIYIFIQAITSL